MTTVATRRASMGFWLAVILQLADLITFHLAVTTFGVPLSLEDNNLMGTIYSAVGVFGIVAAKTALIVYLYVALSYMRSFRALAIVFVSAIGLLGTVTNIMAILWFGT